MSLQFETGGLRYDTYAPFTDRLRAIYALMDQKYTETAKYYKFHCTGCQDNCCLTRFYHHTLLEYLLLLDGYTALGNEQQDEARSRAYRLCTKTARTDEQGISVRRMCPLNFDGLCILYSNRPMICRLHGIPHELHRPGQSVLYGSGCDAFTKQCRRKDYFPFDRTPFYFELAELEKELRRAVGMREKITMTVAQMIIDFGN